MRQRDLQTREIEATSQADTSEDTAPNRARRSIGVQAPLAPLSRC